MQQEFFFRDLAKNVLYHRKKTGLSQAELAKMAGVGKTVIFDIEHGKQTVRIDSILKTLAILNIKIELTGPFIQAAKDNLQ